MTKNLLQIKSILINNIRTYIKKYNWKNEGIQYPGFKYYPRTADFKDPPYMATKLFRVQRIKPVRGNPYWEKQILKMLHLDGKANDIAIVKNIPEINSLLWKIKHLIKISPITFPDKIPTENDASCTFLQENGQVVIKKYLQPSAEVIKETEKFENNPLKLDGNTLRRNSRLKWLHGWSTDL